jgi:hypothetical protein
MELFSAAARFLGKRVPEPDSRPLRECFLRLPVRS